MVSLNTNGKLTNGNEIKKWLQKLKPILTQLTFVFRVLLPLILVFSIFDFSACVCACLCVCELSFVNQMKENPSCP